jgi:hypothetical protein
MLVLVMAILLATSWGSAAASSILNVFVTNDSSHPVPVHEQGTATVHVNNLPATQAVSITQPASSFSRSFDISDAGPSAAGIRGPDGAGTRYAISSLTVTAPGDSTETATLTADPVVDGFCQLTGQNVLEVSAPAHETSSVSLPQPLISNATGGGVCLDIQFSGAEFAAVTGYTLP